MHMSSLVSLLDHLLRLIGIVTELMILFIIVYARIAPRLWMMRVYLLSSLLRMSALFAVEHFGTIHDYRQAYNISEIIGHVILLLFAVEIMGILLAGPKKALGVFYSLALALMIFVAVSYLGFPSSTAEIALFTQKAVAASLFLLMFTCAAQPTFRWPYFGFSVGLGIMLTLDLLCLVLQRWSLAHDLRHYTIVHYSFPIASIIGYLTWLCVCLHPTSVSPVSRQEALQDLLSATKLHEMNEALKEFIRR